MKPPLIEKLAVGPLQANCYIIACPETLRAAIIDPGGDEREIVARVTGMGAEPVCVIDTHAHPDHTGANAALMEHYAIPLFIHEDEEALLAQSGVMGRLIGLIFPPSPPPGRLLRDGEEIAVGSLKLAVLHTPGHSPGSICLFHRGDDAKSPVLFSGDTVFEGSVGRTDLPGGSYQALMRSIREKIIPLPDATRILTGHGPATTLAREKRHNPYIRQGTIPLSGTRG